MAKILSLVVQNALKFTFKAPENQIFLVKRPPDLSFPSNLLLLTYLFSPSYMEELLLKPCHHPCANTHTFNGFWKITPTPD